MPVCIGITDNGGQTRKKTPYWCVGKNESEYVCGGGWGGPQKENADNFSSEVFQEGLRET